MHTTELYSSDLSAHTLNFKEGKKQAHLGPKNSYVISLEDKVPRSKLTHYIKYSKRGIFNIFFSPKKAKFKVSLLYLNFLKVLLSNSVSCFSMTLILKGHVI